ncbi:unnamed protein product [Symbiodinium necroappetens]|uniref:Uncharacterized protein n=1 Tax=Symbiodinium necroappetens TaxID=1628268 RepID=A0A812PNT2_9DINO|nr:unnamed protein product [Symbiodinium necroappetens]
MPLLPSLATFTPGLNSGKPSLEANMEHSTARKPAMACGMAATRASCRNREVALSKNTAMPLLPRYPPAACKPTVFWPEVGSPVGSAAAAVAVHYRADCAKGAGKTPAAPLATTCLPWPDAGNPRLGRRFLRLMIEILHQ